MGLCQRCGQVLKGPVLARSCWRSRRGPCERCADRAVALKGSGFGSQWMHVMFEPCWLQLSLALLIAAVSAATASVATAAATRVHRCRAMLSFHKIQSRTPGCNAPGDDISSAWIPCPAPGHLLADCDL